jgi:hypothetical protein
MSEHCVHYYDDDAELVGVVVEYVAAGLAAGERVIVVATSAHLGAIERGLAPRVDVRAARARGLLQTPDAARTLALFLVDGVPDPELFETHVARRVTDALRDGTPVRAFGEMVALLWEQGNVVGVVQLERLWNDLLLRESFSLCCAYHVSALSGASLAEINRVCHEHSVVYPPASYDRPFDDGPDREGDPGVRSAVFLPVPEAVGATRRFVAAVLDGWDLAPLDWDAALVVSELANNAVNHGASSFRVLVSRAGGRVRVGVHDAAPGRPHRRTAGVGDLNGRGMTIVAALSLDWGCDQLAGGKFTWAELALPSSGGASD